MIETLQDRIERMLRRAFAHCPRGLQEDISKVFPDLKTRPRFDKKTYQRDYMRRARAKKKLQEPR